MGNRQGFTLIELLAVIVILAIVALIATPIILTVIEDVKKSSFEASVLGIKETVEKEYIATTLTKTPVETIYAFNDGNQTVSPEGQEPLQFSGSAPKEGYVKLYEDGSIELGLTDGNYYVRKDRTGEVADVEDYIENSPEQPISSSTYIISYISSSGGSVSPSSLKVNRGDNASAPSITVNSGYHFVDFEVTSGAGNATLDTSTGALTNIIGSLTVRANFASNQLTVTYDGNGGTCTPASEIVEYQTSSNAPSCTRVGYLIDGFTITSGSCDGTFNSSTGVCSDVQTNMTIRADWVMTCNPNTCEGCSIGESCGGGQFFFQYAPGFPRYVVASSDETSTYTWQGAIDHCNSVTYGGYNDWILEDSQLYGYALDVKDTLGGFTADYYWTSTETHTDGPNAWARHFGTGDFLAADKTTYHIVRCMRQSS